MRGSPDHHIGPSQLGPYMHLEDAVREGHAQHIHCDTCRVT
jgi:hypothetical protein